MKILRLTRSAKQFVLLGLHDLLIVWLIVALVFPPHLFASDHADPMELKVPESGITDLFAFPDGENLIVILDVRPNLTRPAPFQLSPFVYTIHMDLQQRVTFDDASQRRRYGGTIAAPESIQAGVTINLRLNNDATLAAVDFTGLDNVAAIQRWSGVRDDPFIQPAFMGKNIVAMVLAIPFTSFPAGQQDWLLWATSSRKGRQIDHVGRSLRTMLPRFETLNKLHPAAHVREINRLHDRPSLLEDIKRTYIFPLFAQRDYDRVPDVMIFTRRLPPGYPNGRLLADDVGRLTMEQGDALLWEQSYNSLGGKPRPIVNDKPFLATFPYLAEPWEDPTPPPAPRELFPASKMKLTALAVVALLALVAENILILLLFRRRRTA